MANRAVLVNPAVSPQLRFDEFVGKDLPHYYSDEITRLTESDLDDLIAADSPCIHQPKKYWLMVQKGDETLDYRLAVDKYEECRQLVEPGGSHTFDDYDQWLPKIIQFLNA